MEQEHRAVLFLWETLDNTKVLIYTHQYTHINIHTYTYTYCGGRWKLSQISHSFFDTMQSEGAKSVHLCGKLPTMPVSSLV